MSLRQVIFTAIFVGVVELFTVACGGTGIYSSDHQEVKSYVQNYVDSFKYGKSSVTGLCFAVKDVDSHDAVAMNVPCTPEVEKEISK